MDHTQSSRLRTLKTLGLLTLSLFFISTMVQPGLCSGTVNITDFDEAVGEQLGLEGSEAQLVGGMILSSIVFLMFFLPIAFLTKGKSPGALAVAMALPLVLCVGMSWLNSWVLILVVLLIAGFFANTLRNMI